MNLDVQLQELDHFLLYEVDSDETMTLDILDGFLHAIAVGPTMIHPQQWLPKIWGQDPVIIPMQSNEQLNRLMDLVMCHYNGIVSGLECVPPQVTPVWGTRNYRGKTYREGEGWSYGFVEGMQLCRDDWKPLLDSKAGKEWFRPIGLLGESAFSPDQDRLTKTPPQRVKITDQIPRAVLAIYQYWLPYRRGVHQREVAKAMWPKIGRNAPCPCGSGKKYKKCCGAADTLH